MRFALQTIVFALLGAAQAADLSANQLCGSKEECETNCENGAYHTESAKGSTYLACAVDQPVKYTLGSCVQQQGEAEEFRPTRQQLRALCESVNGQICNAVSCVFIQTQSNLDGYRDGCLRLPRTGHGFMNNLSYEKLQSTCKRW